LYSKLPTPTAKKAQEVNRLRKDVVQLKREMAATSAQDEFSKWAKLRRAHDKAVAEHEKSGTLHYSDCASQSTRLKPMAASAIQAAKTNFDRAVNILRWLSTNGTRYLLQFWFSKQAMFWLPQGWVPGYVEWILAFPRAPTGSISIQVWGIACASVISMVSEAIVALYTLVQKQKQAQVGLKNQPMAFDSTPEKKEL